LALGKFTKNLITSIFLQQTPNFLELFLNLIITFPNFSGKLQQVADFRTFSKIIDSVGNLQTERVTAKKLKSLQNSKL